MKKNMRETLKEVLVYVSVIIIFLYLCWRITGSSLDLLGVLFADDAYQNAVRVLTGLALLAAGYICVILVLWILELRGDLLRDINAQEDDDGSGARYKHSKAFRYRKHKDFTIQKRMDWSLEDLSDEATNTGG